VLAPTAAAGITLDRVGDVLLFVAPGFFARVGYTARFPQPKQGDFYALVASLAASVPIVALGHALADWLGWHKTATNLAYVSLLLALGLAGGYLVARVRGSEHMRAVLRWLKIPFAPEATVYERTVLKLPEEGEVTVTFNDGRIASGYPAVGPALVTEGAPHELYLAHPRWWSADPPPGQWRGDPMWQGMVINLDEVATVMLSHDPLPKRRRSTLRFWKRKRAQPKPAPAAAVAKPEQQT
jgi:hypothetical protein